MTTLHFRKAENKDVEQLVILINRAYRGQEQQQWTTEAHYIQGDRISVQQLEQQQLDSNFELWLGETVDPQHSRIVTCIGLSFL